MPTTWHSNSHFELQSPVQAVGVLLLVLYSPTTFFSLSASMLTHSLSLQCYPFPSPPEKMCFPRSCSVVHPPENTQENNHDFGDSFSYPTACLLNPTDGMLVYSLLQSTRNVPGTVPSTLWALSPFNSSMDSGSRCSECLHSKGNRSLGKRQWDIPKVS